MSPAFWPLLMASLKDSHPEVFRWLQTLGPLTNPTHGLRRLQLKVFKAVRSWQLQYFLRTCQSY